MGIVTRLDTLRVPDFWIEDMVCRLRIGFKDAERRAACRFGIEASDAAERRSLFAFAGGGKLLPAYRFARPRHRPCTSFSVDSQTRIEVDTWHH